MDSDRLERAVGEILAAVGEDPLRPDIQHTPARVARWWSHMCGGMDSDPLSFLSPLIDQNASDVVVLGDIRVTSVCEHHLAPFYGTICLAYRPGRDGIITGLSNITKMVDAYARRLQIQERLTEQIATALWDALDPAGVMVIGQFNHLCMTVCDEPRAQSIVSTLATRGIYADSPSEQSAVWSLLQRSSRA